MTTMTLHNRTTGEPIGVSAEKGLECPKCGCRDFRVVKTKPMVNLIQRVRKCRHCDWQKRSIERFIS